MINWEVIIGLTILCLMLVGIWELASALYKINFAEVVEDE